MDAKAYPARELARLYARCWRIELCLDDLKATLGMDQLRCKSPQMVHKELELSFIAYKFLRLPLPTPSMPPQLRSIAPTTC